MTAPAAAPVGVLVVDKPAGWTSHDVVGKLRRLAMTRQIGHAGTLDPMATGVLVLCLGRATRLLEYVTGQTKTYLAEITLGATTNTYDAEGEVIARAAVPPLTLADLDRALEAFRGTIWQRPPAFSALKRDGVPLYQRARAGEVVEVEPRPVQVYALELLAWDGERVQIRLRCGAGTYVRSLAHDLGEQLGCGAHLSALRREAVGSFTLASAVTLEYLAAAGVAQALLPLDAAVQHLPRLDVNTVAAQRLWHGQTLSTEAGAGEIARVYGPEEQFLGIVTFDAARSSWRPHKMLADAGE
ncbi:MAG: tRNA pseudouridine(55) synthase TruB [Anaerolineae bacterium]